MNEIIFQRGEYRITDEGVAVLLKAILDKMPAPTRKRFAPLDWQKQYHEKLAEMTQAGIDIRTLGQFLDLNAGQTSTGRAWNVMYKVLTGLDLLRLKYSAAAVNAAMNKVIAMGEPKKCTAPYLAAILRNTGEALPAVSTPLNDRDVYPQAALPIDEEEAWQRIMRLLEARINSASWRTWLAPCQMIACSPEKLHISVPSSVHVDWLTDIFTGVFLQAGIDVFGERVKVIQFTSREEME